MENIPPVVLEDCCQLVKENSIQGNITAQDLKKSQIGLGCKESKVVIVYTPWANLKKTNGMEVGQVGFHNQKIVLKETVEKKKEILKRLEKTKEEKYPNLAGIHPSSAFVVSQISQNYESLETRMKENKKRKN
jgi:hypothetical protein